jgi:hypothetical protein
MFSRLIICTFQFVFLAETLFFSHKKSAGTMFQLVLQRKRMRPKLVIHFLFIFYHNIENLSLYGSEDIFFYLYSFPVWGTSIWLQTFS